MLGFNQHFIFNILQKCNAATSYHQNSQDILTTSGMNCLLDHEGSGLMISSVQYQ